MDVHVARALYPVLLEVVRAQEVISFSDLLARTQSRHEDPEHPIHKQIATSMGRRLEALRGFTNELGYPDLSCIVVSKGETLPPHVYHNPETAQAAVAAFDWSDVEEEIGAAFSQALLAACPRPKRNRDDAKQLMSQHYFGNRRRYSPDAEHYREMIILQLMEGADVEDVFAEFELPTSTTV